MSEISTINSESEPTEGEYWLEEETEVSEVGIKTWIWSEVVRPRDFSISDLKLCQPSTRHQLKSLKTLNDASLPVAYDDRYYNLFLPKSEARASPCWSKLAYWDDNLVGAVCCKVDYDQSNEEQTVLSPKPVVTKKTKIDQFFEPVRKAQKLPTVTKKRGSMHLQTLVCHPEFRRLGIASLLIGEVVKFCKDNTSRIFDTTAENFSACSIQASNVAAVSLYEKFGFQAVERVVNYYRRIESPDALRMELSLL